MNSKTTKHQVQSALKVISSISKSVPKHIKELCETYKFNIIMHNTQMAAAEYKIIKEAINKYNKDSLEFSASLVWLVITNRDAEKAINELKRVK